MNVGLLISTKFIIWRNMKLFSWRDKIDFFSVLDESIWFCFLFYTNDFHTRLKMSSYICELRVWGLWILISKFQYFNFNWTNNILCFKSNWFDLKLKILNLVWFQEIILLYFQSIFSCGTPKILFGKYWNSCFLNDDS